jgi:hypothetical protein
MASYSWQSDWIAASADAAEMAFYGVANAGDGSQDGGTRSQCGCTPGWPSSLL